MRWHCYDVSGVTVVMSKICGHIKNVTVVVGWHCCNVSDVTVVM